MNVIKLIRNYINLILNGYNKRVHMELCVRKR